jgi:ESCRT-II complex subunit VPS36
MFLRPLDLTTALRPSLLPEEVLLFVQDAVGLYEGKFKIPNYQNGQAYLTSHRVCYVDNEDPRKFSVAVDLQDVDHPEFYVSKSDKLPSPQADHIPRLASSNRLQR